jgi:hypothetical protein
MTKPFIPRHVITLEIQNFHVKSRFPNFNYRWSHGVGLWTGFIKPTPLSTSYKVKISYKLGSIPDVFVLEPELKTRAGTVKIPHTYEAKRPCIYDPKTDWDKSRFIAETIIPWFSLWLYFYEVWFQTGKWLGEGRHPEIKPDKSTGKGIE